ncbi:MAG TPA: epimerase [Thermoanaerobaculia bacterium]|nr:epimerase [Thermoanaerobaculia bacterium]
MVGQGVLRECLLDPEVGRVLTVGRNATGQQHPKLRELVVPNLFDYSAVESDLAGYDACIFTLGVSAAGMTEEAYSHMTYDLTLAAATTLARLNPGLTFVYVSGQGTDSSEQGRMMWARVKGRTENALLRLFQRAFLFRPGFIQPLHGIRSKTKAYQMFYTLLGPILPLLRRLFPRHITTTEQLGRAMLKAAKGGTEKRVLEMPDITGMA